MADIEIQTGEFSRYRNSLIREHDLLKVFLWICGPEKPLPPERPATPKGKAGDPEYDLAVIELKDKLADYEAELKRYGQLKAEYDDWQTRIGGPVEQMFWSCDASDALRHDQRAVSEGRQKARRYFISSRTRGYRHLENGGLPPGVTPGRGQRANVDRQAADDAALEAARRSDPVFGEGSV